MALTYVIPLLVMTSMDQVTNKFRIFNGRGEFIRPMAIKIVPTPPHQFGKLFVTMFYLKFFVIFVPFVDRKLFPG